MTRISENQNALTLWNAIRTNRANVSKLSEQLSSGVAVRKPSDSNNSSTIIKFQDDLNRIDGYSNRIASVKSFLGFQENALRDAGEILLRASEIATQASNETNSAEARRQLSEEVIQLRDHMVSLANSTYQGRYVWGGADDDDPPYDNVPYSGNPTDPGYQFPGTGNFSERYRYDGEAGTAVTRSVQVSDDVTVQINTPGSQVFDNAIFGLERLARHLRGFSTNLTGEAPDGDGIAYVFPDDYAQQTQDIKSSLDLLKLAREQDIMVERVSVAGRERRVETAEALIGLTKTSAQEVIDKLQSTDMFSAASELTIAQTALQASLAVTTQVLRQSILDYL